MTCLGEFEDKILYMLLFAMLHLGTHIPVLEIKFQAHTPSTRFYAIDAMLSL